MPPAAWLAPSYLLGSIPFAWIVTRAVRGVDLRSVGSGNVGATNASRALGGKWFLAVFLLDAAKGAGAVLLFAPLAGLSAPWDLRLAMGCGLAAILGHVFPVWLGFRGGKGVSTGAGVAAALAPLPAAAAFAAFLAVLLPFRFMSLASIAGAAALPFAAWALGSPPELTGFCALVAVLVLVLHRRNLARIAAGTEPRMFERKREEPTRA